MIGAGGVLGYYAAPIAFDDPAAVTAGFEAGTPTSVTSNTVSLVTGQRALLLFSQIRGNAASPSTNRTVSTLAGTGDFTGIALGDWTIHEELVQRDDADQGGVGAYIATWVSTITGTGAFTLTWSGSVWATLNEAHVLPACDVIDSDSIGGNNAAVSVAPTFAATPAAGALIFSVAVQRADTAFGVPTGFTASANASGAIHNRHRTAWRNGGAAAATTWSGMDGSHPIVAAAAQFRRT